MGRAIKAWGRYRQARQAGQQTRYVGFPRFRKKGLHDRYTASNGRNTIRIEGQRVWLPGIGGVRMREALRWSGTVIAVTLSCEADRWFAAIQVDTGVASPPLRQGATVGIDMGLETLATLSAGTTYENPRALQEALADLRRVDKAIARSRQVVRPPGIPAP